MSVLAKLNAQASRIIKEGTRQNWVDRAVAWVSPTRGAARMHARLQMASAAHYTSASRERRTLGNWGVQEGDANAILAADRPDLINRSHDLMRNSPLAIGSLQVINNKTVGTGLALAPEPARELLGWSEDQASTWADKVEMQWRAWAESKRCHAEMRDDFYGLPRTSRAELVRSQVSSAMETGRVWALFRQFVRGAT